MSTFEVLNVAEILTDAGYQKMSEIMQKVIVTINNDTLLCDESTHPTKSETDQFLKKFRMLEESDLENAFRVSSEKFFEVLNQMVVCVGCRRSSEAFYQQLIDCDCGKSPFHPICVDKGGTLSLTKDHMNNMFLCALFHCPSVKMQKMAESLRKSKPGKRCTLHSMDSQRLRCIGACTEVWDYISGKCQETSVCVDAKTLMETIEQYSVRHRFCTDCKSKVLNAYHLLVGESDGKKVSGYMANLYEGITFNPEDRSLQISCKANYFEHLVSNAASATVDLLGLGSGQQERHAKTMEMAQQEVLTCLGICIYERLHRIQTRCREQQQTCEIVMCVAIQAFRRGFEQAIEEKLGVSQLELLCEEISKTDLAEKQRKTLKKLKRKKKKMKKAEVNVKQQITAEDETDDMNTDIGKEASIPEKSNKNVDGKKSNETEFPVKSCNSNKLELGIANQNQNHNLKLPDIGFAVKSEGDTLKCKEKKQDNITKNILGKDAQGPYPEDNFGSQWQINESGDKKWAVTKDEQPILLGCSRQDWILALEMSSSSSEYESDDDDFLPDVDKSVIHTPVWKAMRIKERKKLRADFHKMLTNLNSEANDAAAMDCQCCGDTGPATYRYLDTSGQPKENNLNKKERILRPGGTNKSRAMQSAKKYKGKNRR